MSRMPSCILLKLQTRPFHVMLALHLTGCSQSERAMYSTLNTSLRRFSPRHSVMRFSLAEVVLISSLTLPSLPASPLSRSPMRMMVLSRTR